MTCGTHMVFPWMRGSLSLLLFRATSCI
jgi:hypothetical protein